MRTSDVPSTCRNFTNALCTLYNGALLKTLNISTLDSVEVSLQKIELWAESVSSSKLNNTIYNSNGEIPDSIDRKIILQPKSSFFIGDLAGNQGLFVFDNGFSYTDTNGNAIQVENGVSLTALDGLYLELDTTPTFKKQALIDAGDGKVEWGMPVPPNYTVDELPLDVEEGSIAYVTDADSISYRGDVIGGGTEKALVFFNSEKWLYH